MRIAKGIRPERVSEVVDTLVGDVKTSMALTKVDRIVIEDIQVPKGEKHVSYTCNGDGLVQFALTHPIAFY